MPVLENLTTVQTMYESAIDNLATLTTAIVVPDPQATVAGLTAVASVTGTQVAGAVTMEAQTVTDLSAPADIAGSSEFPTFDVAAPVLDIPNDVLPAMPADPGDAPVISDSTAPLTVTVPTVADLTLQELSLPAAPELVQPTFSQVAPVFSATLPTISLDFDRTPYQSSLADTLRSVLVASLTAATGLPSEAESAAFNLLDEEEKYAIRLKVDAILSESGKRGFHKIVTAFKASQMLNEYALAKTDISRKLAIKQMEIEQGNIEQAIQDIIALDTRYFQEVSERANRLLEAAKYTNDAAYKLFTVEAEVYNDKVSRYEADVVVYEAEVQVVRAIAEKYKAQIEGVTAQAEGNTVLAEYYTAQIAYLSTAVDKYRAEMEARAAGLQIDKARLEGYAASISGFQARIEGKTAEFAAYIAEVESVKAEADAQVAIAMAAAQQAEGQKVIAQEAAAVASVNFEARKAVAEMNVRQHEAAKIEAEAAAIYVKTASAENKVEAERIQAETLQKVAAIEKIIQENKRDIIAADMEQKKIIEDEEKATQLAINAMGLASATQLSANEMNARLTEAAALSERWHTGYNTTNSQEHLNAAQRISALSVKYG